VLDGSKAFITNCGTEITSITTVTARTEDGISAFVVPGHTRLHHRAAVPQARLARLRHPRHHDGRLPRARSANLLGKPGHGFRNFLTILDDGRIAISALALGCARAAFDMALEYAKERNAFGGPIGANQGLAFQLSDLAVQIENAHNLTYKAAWLKDQGRPIGQAAAIAKLYTTEAAMDAVRVGTQVLGGMGFMEETPMARFYRDAKILEIGEGTSEIQRSSSPATSACRWSDGDPTQMVTIDDVEALVTELPAVGEGTSYGNRCWVVASKNFAWIRPFSKADVKRFGDAPVPSGPILAVRVEDLMEKDVVLDEGRPGFFTIPHFDGYAAVLIQLDAADAADVEEAIVGAWLAMAPRELADEYLRTGGSDRPRSGAD
jgi:hypothetical protein